MLVDTGVVVAGISPRRSARRQGSSSSEDLIEAAHAEPLPRRAAVFRELLPAETPPTGAEASAACGTERRFPRIPRRLIVNPIKRCDRVRMEAMARDFLDRVTSQAFDVLEQGDFFDVAKRQRHAAGARAGGSSDPVNVALRIIRHLVIDNVG